jgi:hypothetical protein
LSIVGQALLVELALKILESKSIVQDSDIASWRRVEVRCIGTITLLDWSCGDKANNQDGDDY